MLKTKNKSLFVIILLLLSTVLITLNFRKIQELRLRALGQKADIVVDASKVIGPLPQTWRALAQGGEEKGVRMLENVISQVSQLSPRYIRLDHLYDFYNVVARDSSKSLTFNWEELDATVCDILRIGARPFFSLSYMPEVLSVDRSIISHPASWEEWSLLIQKTIERYSGENSRICGLFLDQNLTDVYYEVWNEPDLESFGKWNIHGGVKDYKLLYYYSIKGAEKAENVKRFFFGGPATTAAYQNWFQVFLDFVRENNLRIDFLSWHHYSKKPDDFTEDLLKIDSWLVEEKYTLYRNLPRIISEWGFDSDPNPLSFSETAAAHTVAAIRNLIEQKLEMAFVFEIKDGPTPRWGILSYNGEEKSRYKALKLLNNLGQSRLYLEGEGTWVKGLASREFKKISLILVNYDLENKHDEAAPVTFLNLEPGIYQVVQSHLEGNRYETSEIVGEDGILHKQVYLPANTVVVWQIEKK